MTDETTAAAAEAEPVSVAPANPVSARPIAGADVLPSVAPSLQFAQGGFGTIPVGSVDSMAKIEAAIRPLALPITEMSEDPRNARKHMGGSITVIRRSLRQFGQQKPIVIDSEGVIVAGNGTYRAAREMGWSHVAALRTSLTGNEKLAYALADNRTQEMSEWDDLALGKLLLELEAEAGPMLLDATGFSAEDSKHYVGLLGQEAADQLAAIQAANEFTDSGDAIGQEGWFWCAITQHFDTGTGICRHGCLYCNILNTRTMAKAKTIKPKRPAVIFKKLELCAKKKTCLSVGCTIDPAMSELRAANKVLLEKAKELGVYIVIQTKDPRACLPWVVESRIPPEQLTFKTAFTFLDEVKARTAEPFLPAPEKRIAALEDAHERGYDVVLANSPLIFDAEEGWPELIDRFKGKCTRFCQEHLILQKTAIRYWRRIEPALGCTIEEYAARWGVNDRVEGAMFRWVWDPRKTRPIAERFRKWANDAGMMFANGHELNAMPIADLNQGDYCCQTEAQKRFGVQFDKDSLCCRCANGRLDELILPSLSAKIDDDEKWMAEYHRVAIVNSPVVLWTFGHMKEAAWKRLEEEVAAKAKAAAEKAKPKPPKNAKKKKPVAPSDPPAV